MALIRWRPREVFDPFREIFDFGDFPIARRLSREGIFGGEWAPAIDLCQTKESVVAKADLPGLKKEDIDLTIVGDTLTIRGEKKQESEVKEESYHRIERSYGSFQRSVALPCPVDAGKVKAAYKNGVLEVVMPKKEEAAPRKIDVRVE